MEEALGGLSKKDIGSESGKHSGHMSDMFLHRFGKEHNIIQINHHINTKKILENIIAKILRRCRSIDEPKRHNQVLITAIFSSQSCKMFITLLDSEKAICTTQINLGEDRRTIQEIEKLIHRRNRILVIHSNSIEFVVINTQMEATSCFLANRTGAPIEEELGWMKPFSRFSET
ncbi:hypothetical protein O181_079579 [Austropuccinia psidii MF-1]|uniref:Uncharacterized protein n=1 Tax=Austropuccinia psidii MF-1 TaxID=1389203 RepID=A0A9Q3FIR7_9BASI|nr:hypothetical protein [Austropuccinia psidii MF-1]